MKEAPDSASNFSQVLGYLTAKPSSALWYSVTLSETFVVSLTTTGAEVLAVTPPSPVGPFHSTCLFDDLPSQIARIIITITTIPSTAFEFFFMFIYNQ